ncbi:MAG: DUF3604 domain-containing protein, partial [Robiginitomaculum sp.]|nr:DUF3604 domain-containing protein [Robiginitomaculum sp.]
MKKILCIGTCLIALTACSADKTETSNAQIGIPDPAPTIAEINAGEHYSPPANAQYPTRVFWGDTHLHTELSQDAFMFGVTLGPADAYQFAKGLPVKATHGEIAKIDRPLDFLVIADHAEGLGGMIALMNGHEKIASVEKFKGWKKILSTGTPEERRGLFNTTREDGWPKELDDPQVKSDAWAYQRNTADTYNEPGKFTALIGFEWSSWPGGSNLHRVVIFRDGAEKTGKTIPYSYHESDRPEDLWAYLAAYEAKTGGQVLAIPHNGNLSNGLLYPITNRDGQPLSADYTKTRAHWEPLMEITQIKGDGETHKYLSPSDEFADYETWDFGNFAGVPKKDEMLEFEYARSALKNGLKLETATGTNPYKFGMIGSTDSHTALSTAQEDNFFGKHSAGMEPGETRWKDPIGKAKETAVPGFLMASSGFAAVWAKENTRESLFDAMRRKEVYATTGSRMTVRLFGGWNYNAKDAQNPNFASIGYAGGVPMGGDLQGNEGRDGDAPHFLVAASKDPLGANLDRVQIIKGW